MPVSTTEVVVVGRNVMIIYYILIRVEFVTRLYKIKDKN